jgi:hypothetical protein
MKHKNTTHGHWVNNKPSKTYSSWRAMRYRCLNPKNTHYFQQGIRVCDRWQHSFENFLEDMGERPDGCTINRIDNSKGYSPENCEWATIVAQNNNKKISNKCPLTGKFIPN